MSDEKTTRVRYYYSDSISLPKRIQGELCIGESYNHDSDYATYVVKVVDGEPELLGHDDVEPEDKSFGRDLNWVLFELQQAYELGLRHGAEPYEKEAHG